MPRRIIESAARKSRELFAAQQGPISRQLFEVAFAALVEIKLMHDSPGGLGGVRCTPFDWLGTRNIRAWKE